MQIIGFVVLAFLFIYFWPTSILLVGAIGLLGFFLYKGSEATSDVARTQLAAWRERLKLDCELTTIIENARYAIGWDSKHQRLALIELTGDGSWIDLDRIRSVELERTYSQHHEGYTETRTGRGSQLVGAGVGAAIAGPAGLVVGGLSGKTFTETEGTSQQFLDSLTIKLRLRSTTLPLMSLGFSKDFHEVEVVAAQISNAIEDRKEASSTVDASEPFPRFAATAQPQVQEGWWSKTFG